MGVAPSAHHTSAATIPPTAGRRQRWQALNSREKLSIVSGVETTTCDTCAKQVHLLLDQVLELRVMRVLVCLRCAERLVCVKPVARSSARASAERLADPARCGAQRSV
jgi:hypothetical protein